MLYDNFKLVCKRKGTSLTAVLKEIGRSTGLTGKWRGGADPSLQIVMEMAAHLGVSIDEMCYGEPSGKSISPQDQEWLDIISRIPEDKHAMLKDFLRTHMVIPEKYVDKRDA